jgi:hypothetical protein
LKIEKVESDVAFSNQFGFFQLPLKRKGWIGRTVKTSTYPDGSISTRTASSAAFAAEAALE